MKKIKNIIYIVYLLLLSFMNIQSTFAYVITSAEKITNTFIPGEFPLNDMTLTKEIEHSYGSDYIIPENLSFNFEINMGELNANRELETSKGKIQTDENGITRLTLKPGENIHIENIIEGSKIKVTEIQNKEGFTVKDSLITQEGTILKDKTLNFNYTNIYKAMSATGESITLTGTKVLEGREWREGDTFTFDLEYKTQEGEWLKLGTKIVEYNSENENFNKFDFTDMISVLEFDRIGIHNFRIIEVEGELENIDYDKTINYFNIVVADDEMDGKIDIKEINAFQNVTIKNEDNKHHLDVTFNSLFDVTEIKDIELNIVGKKIIKNTGKYKIGPEDFEFVLENLETQEKQTLRTDTDGNALFTLKYTKDDIGKTFTYKITETNELKEFITYSEKEYIIKVEINLNKDDELEAKVKINNEEAQKIEVDFENIYHKVDPIGPPKDIIVNITANKKVKNTGDYEIGPENFEFVLEENETKKQIISKSNKEGKATFDITYTGKDVGKTYTYKLTEKNTERENVIYSNASYIIKISIELNDKNTLIPTILVNNKDIKDAKINFENIYHKVDYVIRPDDLKVRLSIQNIVKNMGDYNLGPENFEFILTNKETTKKQKVKTDQNGQAHIDFTYTADDIGKTYNYAIAINPGNISEMIYSKLIHNVSITINLNEKNEIVAVIMVNEKNVDEIVLEYINIYNKKSPLPPTTGVDENVHAIDARIALVLVCLIMMFVIKKFKEESTQKYN